MEGLAVAIGLLEEAIATVGTDVSLEAEIETGLGLVLLETFQLLAADEHLARAAELADRVGDRNLLAQAMALRVCRISGSA